MRIKGLNEMLLKRTLSIPFAYIVTMIVILTVSCKGGRGIVDPRQKQGYPLYMYKALGAVDHAGRMGLIEKIAYPNKVDFKKYSFDIYYLWHWDRIKFFDQDGNALNMSVNANGKINLHRNLADN